MTAAAVSGAGFERLAERCVLKGWRMGITAVAVSDPRAEGMVLGFLEVRDVKVDPPDLLVRVRCASRGELDAAVEQAEHGLRLQGLLP